MTQQVLAVTEMVRGEPGIEGRRGSLQSEQPIHQLKAHIHLLGQREGEVWRDKGKLAKAGDVRRSGEKS